MVSYGAASNLDDLIYLRGVDLAVTQSDVFEYFRTERKTPSLQSRSIEGAGIFSLGGNQLTGFNNLSTSVSGTITGDGSVIKTGSGTLTLSGINSYTGPTIVNAGALIVDGWIAPSSLTTVQAGALLTGTGTVGATTILSRGGASRPVPDRHARFDERSPAISRSSPGHSTSCRSILRRPRPPM